MIYKVIVMRPVLALKFCENFEKLQDLQYIAYMEDQGSFAKTAAKACEEAYQMDKRDGLKLPKQDYSVLGVVTGSYLPFLNGKRP